MWPILFDSPPGLDLPPVAPYGVMVLIALVLGQLLALELAGRVGIDRGRLGVASVVAVIVGFIGAKTFYVFATGNPFSMTGGFAFYGGAVAGGLGLVVACKAIGLPTLKVLDIGAPVIVLGHALGRLGCFFAGCCHGIPIPHAHPATSLLPEGMLEGEVLLHPHAPWMSNVFYGGAARFTDVPLYPTQLWLFVGNLFLLGLLLWLFQRRRFDGQLAALTLLIEPALRATVEAYRGDHRGYAVQWETAGDGLSAGAEASAALGGLTSSQGVALCLMVVGAVLFMARFRKGVAAEVAVEGAADPLLDAMDEL